MKKSNQQDIDHLFSTGLENHQTPVPDPDSLWDSIIHGRKRRRMLPYFYSGLAVIFFTLSGSAWYSFGTSNSMTISNYVDATDVESESAYHGVAKDTPTDILSSVYSAASVTVEVEELIEKSEGKYQLEKEKPSTPRTTGVEIVSGGLDILEEPEFEKSSLNTNKRSAEVAGSNENTSIRKNEISGVDNSMNSPAESPEEIGTEGRMKKSSPEFRSKYNFARIENEIDQFEIEFLKKKIKNPLDDCVVGLEGHLFAEIYGVGGISLDNNSLQLGAQDQQSYFTNWNEANSTLPTIGIGLQVGYEFPMGLSVGAGVEYTQFESQYTSTQTITEITTVYNPEAYFYYDDNNEVVWVGDSVTAVTTYDRTSSLASNTRLFNIPVTLSYRLYNRGLFSLSAMAGITFNFSMTHEGHFLQPDNSIVMIDNINADAYVAERLGFSFQGGVRLGYAIAPKWEAFLNPLFHYSGSSYWRSDQTIIQSRNFINVRGGVRYAF